MSRIGINDTSRQRGRSRHRRSRRLGARPATIPAILFALAPSPTHAQVPPSPTAPNSASPAHSPTPGIESTDPDFFTGFWTRSNLLGDAGGLRTLLGNYGVTFGLSETSEVLGNATGGTHTGVAYDGLTILNVGVDTQKAFGLEGGTFNASVLQIHGRSLSTDNLQDLQTASGIEAQRTTRLWELWYQQALLDGRFNIKLGQQSIDQEFITSVGSSLFINTVMGWPALPTDDLYAGGPTYPLSSLGVRLRANSIGPFSMLAGVFDDNPPAGPFNDDGQLRGAARTGTRFNLGTGALFIAEAQYAFNQPANGEMTTSSQPTGLPGTYKLGAWYDTGSFPDQRFATNGVSLASPLSNGNPRMHHGNYSLYGMADQAVWRPDPAGARAVGVFARIMGAPGDHNLISFSVNAGVTMRAPLPGRDNDSFGVGWGIARVGGNVTGFDQDVNAVGSYRPVRTNENFIEVTYQYQAAGWWQVQPDFQYVFMPGGGITNPLDPAKRIANEAILGVRTNITF